MTYNVDLVNGCRVVRGRVAARELAAMLDEWADGQHSSAPLDEMVADAGLARHFGAVVVCGTLGAVNALRTRLEL
ncbi:hypothetical protein [Cupriavidus sp. TMH.W2]|uniref:hypothetical protein n=1 Tax=Cupriavidus sp. TMH.W2 TaxID=3434465 RepID=UPI003D776805